MAILLQHLPALPVARAILRALRTEMARRELRPPVLTRLIVVGQKVSGLDLGYYPGMPRRELDRSVGRLRAWSSRQARADAREVAKQATR